MSSCLMLRSSCCEVSDRAQIKLNSQPAKKYSTPDQVERHAYAKQNNIARVLDIDSCYDPRYVKGKNVLITGGNRGLGFALAREFANQNANVIITSRKPFESRGISVIDGIDMQDNDCGAKVVAAMKGKKIDILVNNAGYFYEPVEKIDSLNFDEEMKMIDICALGVLRITAACFNGGLLERNAKVAIISSQGGSVTWRFTQNPEGHDYGHHMSKAAANMAGALLAQELKGAGVCVYLLHPGFNKSDMTKKYAAIWEIEGAVEASVGAKRVVHEIGLMKLESTGSFINCEDGLYIPW